MKNLSLLLAALLMIAGGAMLGWGLFRGVLSTIQWVIQQNYPTSPASAGLIAGLGLGLLLTGKALARQRSA